MLEKYAEVAVEVGIGLRPGDRLLVRSSVEAVDLTRLIVETAYAAGAVNVDVLWSDDVVSRARFSHGVAEASEIVSSTANFLMRAHELGDLILTIDAKDPDALAGQPVARVGAFQKKNGEFLEPVFTAMGKLAVNWSVVAAPTPQWAKRVFPDDPEEAAIEKLWSAIFRACRLDMADPLEEWGKHLRSLDARRDHLTAEKFSALRYEAPGTDLVLGLPDDVRWEGGTVATPEGRSFAPNIPTEEVFTSPHRLRAEGRVAATKPLSLFGNVVEDFYLEVSDGIITEATAARGREALEQLLDTDEGSMRFGEAAMVPMSSAVAAEGLVWSNTLFDENDGCHIAIGRAYPTCIEGGTEMSRDAQIEAGLNFSTTHVDFVVGSAELDVYGVTGDGTEMPIIAAGEWAFDVDDG